MQLQMLVMPTSTSVVITGTLSGSLSVLTFIVGPSPKAGALGEHRIQTSSLADTLKSANIMQSEEFQPKKVGKEEEEIHKTKTAFWEIVNEMDGKQGTLEIYVV
ncbi:hypothetical protein C0995_004423 [Termitomyces sp. Mi166|nr:hypothetical protein C0995_004423 [Termitomyces sp. Mi166\